jgi:hypothetical protein
MTKIVYAAPGYIPPRGVTVLPLDAHPSIVEDRAFGHTEPLRPNPQYCKSAPGLTLQEIVAILRNGPATVAELAEQIGVTPQAIDTKLRRKAHLFDVVGRRKGGVGQPALVWALRGES